MGIFLSSHFAIKFVYLFQVNLQLTATIVIIYWDCNIISLYLINPYVIE